MSEMSLLDWTVAYIKYKDSVQKRIKTLDANSDKQTVKVINKDDSTATYICSPILKILNTDSLKDEKVVCLNKKENVDWLISKWDIVKDKKCIFLFVNTKRSENWAINPHMHHNITDKSALKPGLKALFESIPEA
jgi:hypothetical protein